MSPTGSAAAFATTAAEPHINEATLNAVATYFAVHIGEHYSPHVTIGVGTVDYLNALLTAPFPTRSQPSECPPINSVTSALPQDYSAPSGCHRNVKREHS